MNILQNQFINILSSAIHDKGVEDYSLKKIKWKSIIDEAKAHNVVGLVYSSVNRSAYLKTVEKNKLEQLKRETFLTGVNQIQHIKQISKVLELLNKKKIPVIVLKGLVIRQLYPKPELRTMCDADILVKREDIDKVKNLLIELGYIVTSHDGKHLRFVHSNHFTIEVHWTLTNTGFYKGKNIFEDHIWENTIKVKVGESEALSLSYEDLVVHLCIHMAAHSTSKGFGIRQLCDLVLLVEKKGYMINWSNFIKKIRICGIEKFTIAIFSICNKLFNMSIPHELNVNLLNERFIYQLIDDIFEAGVHGKRNLSKMFGNQLAYDSRFSDDLSMTKRFLEILFPPVNKLSDRYVYAKKYEVLIPIAWIDHFIRGLFYKKHNFYSKIKFFVLTVHTSKKRNKLLKWLELI